MVLLLYFLKPSKNMEEIKMKIAIGSDHGGWNAKKEIIKRLEAEGHEVLDCGTNGPEMVDYPV